MQNNFQSIEQMLFSGLTVGNPPVPAPVPSLLSPIPIPTALPNDPQGLKGNLELPGSVDAGGNVTAGGNMSAQDITAQNNLGANGNLQVEGSAAIGTSLTTGGLPGIVGGDITCNAPGKFNGDGSGLTNLPPATLAPTPDFFFQSGITGFGLCYNKVGLQEIADTPYVSITCDFFGRPPGLYFWKTDAAISIQNLFNSASGFVWWDGTKVSGESTYSLTWNTNFFPENQNYSATSSYLFFTSLTGFYVQLESTNTSIDPLQPTDYYVNVWKIAGLNAAPAVQLPAPANLNVTSLGSTSLDIAFDPVATATFYVATLTDSNGIVSYAGNATSPITALNLISNETYSVTVAAQNATQTGVSSAPVVAATDPPAPPGNVATSNRTSSSFDVSWTLPGTVDGYVQIQQGANPPDLQGPLTSPTTISTYLGNPLTADTTYTVQVVGIDTLPPFLTSSPAPVPALVVRTTP